MSARILIVDDMLPSVKVLAAKLTGEYYDVLTANDGPTALRAVASEEPDLVLLDVMMPGMDGFEVCRRIKDNPETTHIPVVMVTALSDTSDKVRGLDAGADDFLTKPVSDITLFARVRSLLRLKQMLDQWRLREETTQRLGFQLDHEATGISGREARVTVVDDSVIESANIHEVVTGDHDHVQLFNFKSGIAAEVAQTNPDVVLIGLDAVGDEGLRLASSLRSLEATRQTPILLLGDEEDMGRLIKALEIGVNDYVIRPIDSHELLARVRTQVRRKRYQDRLKASFLHQLSLALTDSLTGLHNRRYLGTHLEAVLGRTADSGKPVSLLMLDIDHFKPINDTFGHAVGDEVLAEIAQRIARNVRGIDLAARYGGEEFCVVMPDTTLDVATAVADRLRAKMAESAIVVADQAAEIPVTVSIGVAEARSGSDTPEQLLKRADDALYAAKNAGRNRVMPPPGENAYHLLREVEIG